MIIKPSNAAVRTYLQERQASKEPPPSPERIREQLGWKLK